MFKLYLDTFPSLVCYALKIADNECHEIGAHLYAFFEVVCTEFYCVVTLQQKFKQHN